MRGLLNSVATPWLLVAAVVISLVVVFLAVLLVRRLVPATREGFHAEISAPMLGVVAALFGLFLAFVIIIAYQNFLGAGENVSQETDSLSSIVRDSASFPEPGGTNVRVAVGTYAKAVVNDEWPMMREGKQSPKAEKALNDIFGAFLTVKPTSTPARSFYNDAVRQLNGVSAARDDRLASVEGGIPGVIIILLLFSTFVIIAYAVFVGSPNFWFHVLGPAAIAVVVAVSIVVLFDLSYPFSGGVTISTSGFTTGELAPDLTAAHPVSG